MGHFLLSLSFCIVAAYPAVAMGDDAVRTAVDAQGAPSATDRPSFRNLGRAASNAKLASREPYADLIGRITTEEQVEAALVHAIIKVESNYDPLAVSRKGAQGLMQLMPGTADRYAVRDPFDPEANIRGGVRYLRFLQETFPGRLPLVLAAYNAGENAVLRHNGIPPYRETRQYVDRVLTHYDRRDAAPVQPVAQTEPAADLKQADEPSPAATIFRVMDSQGDLTYTNIRPTSLSRSSP